MHFRYGLYEKLFVISNEIMFKPKPHKKKEGVKSVTWIQGEPYSNIKGDA